MKYWNKTREARKRTWTQVQWRPHNMNFYTIEVNIEEMKRWCQHQPGGRFWYSEHWADDHDPVYYWTWWFERPSDATTFTLRWL
jgi:hypothetical protein